MAFAPKPSTDPRWAATAAGADASANIVVPASGKLDIGWLPADKPPAQYLNWWQNIVMKWAAYLRDYELQPHLFTPASDTALVREVAAGTTRQLVDQFDNASYLTRIYAPGPGAALGAGLEVTVNAKWSGTQWVADSTGAPASKHSFQTYLAGAGYNFSWKFKQTTTSAWADTAWDTNPAVVGAGGIVFSGSNSTVVGLGLQAYLTPDGYVHLDGSMQCPSALAAGSSLFTLPVGFRPGTRTIRFLTYNWITGNPTPVAVSITSAGLATLVGPTLAAGANLIDFCISFPIFQ